MKRSQRAQKKQKGFKYASNKKTPFKRGGFEKKQNYNTITPKLHTMTHDFLFRNVYKKQKPLSDEKRNHPTSHYRYKFHHSNTMRKSRNNKGKDKRHNKENKSKDNNNDNDNNNDDNDNKDDIEEFILGNDDTKDIPFYEDMDKSKKQYLSDDELNIASSSNESSDDELKFEHFRKDSLRIKHENRKLTAKSKWLQSKIRENSELFEGGLDLQGRVPFKNTIAKRKGVIKGSLVLGSIHSIHEHFVRLYLYGSIPATLTIREVSDILSMEIDHLISNKNYNNNNNNKKGKGLVKIKETLKEESLINKKRNEERINDKHIYYYQTLDELPTCHDIFKRNQIIRCIITHQTKEDGFHVSLRPSLFNSKLRMNDLIPGYCLLCSIKSIEDKGYVIDTGIYVQDKGGENEIVVRAFLNYNDVEPDIVKRILQIKQNNNKEDKEDKEEEEDIIIPIGFPLELVVKKCDTGTNAIWLTLDFKKYYRELTTLPIVPLAALKPGFSVNCFVKKIMKDCMVLEFGKVYQGVVTYSHIEKLLDKKWETNYKIGQKIQARIVLINAEKKFIHLSIKPHLSQQLDDQFLPNSLRYETVIPRRCSEVITADVGRIAYDSLYLYSRLLDPKYVNKDETKDQEKNNSDNDDNDDDDDDDQRKLFPALNKEPLPQVVPIRVTGKHISSSQRNLQDAEVFNSWINRKNVKVKLLRYDAFQGEFQGTLKSSEVEARVLFYKDIKCGMVFECTVKSLDKANNKINVSFSNGLTGHISILHCGDLPPKSLDEPQITAKYKIGSIVKCRVLACIAYKKCVNFTAKPSLVEPTIDSRDPINIYGWNTSRNVISHGVIYKMNDIMGYIVVHFYNSVNAIIPGKDLKLNGYFNKPSDEFYIGQTIKVRVVKCSKNTKRMICSLNLNINDDKKRKNKSNDNQLNDQMYWAKIIKKKDDCFIVEKITKHDENDSDQENEKEKNGEEIDNEISFHKLRLYSILPFDHLSDNSTKSLNLVETNAFEIGDKFQVLTLHKINVARRDIEKQLKFQSRMIDLLGLSQDVVQFENSDRKILSIVSAKDGLLRLHKNQLISKVFPINTRKIQVGDMLTGYISSQRYPSKKHALWIHFNGLLQLPVNWKYIHDLSGDTIRTCIKMSFTGNDDMLMDDDEDNDDDTNNVDLSIYNQGDLVMVKVLDIQSLDGEENEEGKHLVTLTMKPSDLLPNIKYGNQISFHKTFINEWYLSYTQQQQLFIESNDDDDDEEDDNDDIDNDEKEQAKENIKAALYALQIGTILKCRVSEIAETKTVLVEFIPSIESVIGVIKVRKNEHMKIYQQRLSSNKKFKCNILNIDWNEETPIIELYDPINIELDALPLNSVQESVTNNMAIAPNTVIHHTEIIYVDSTYLLVQFAVDPDKNDHVKRYIGIVPMRLPYLIVPTTLIFKVGDYVTVNIVQSSNHFGGIILCNLSQSSLQKYIKTHNKKMKTPNNKRKFNQIEVQREHSINDNDRPAKRQKTMERNKDVIKSANSNILGTVYKAKLVRSDIEKQHFIIDAKHRRLPSIYGGILPFEQLCDNYAMSMKLAASYVALLKNDADSEIFRQNIRVIITKIGDDNSIIFTAKNMIVSHCENHAYPRFNAYQINKKYNKIKRNVPMIGCIDKICDINDEMIIHYGNNVSSIVDYDNAFMLPFDRKEISKVYHKGQTVIGHIENNCKLQKDKLSIQLCKLNKIENHDMIITNQSFIKEYKHMIYAKYLQHKLENDDDDKKYLSTSNINIGDILDVTLTNVTSTLIEFKYQNIYYGKIIRPEHSGAEIEECHPGMNTQILVIDIDYDKNIIFGSIRLSTQTPNILNLEEKKSLMKVDNVLCQLEWISDNGYLILQMVTNNHLIIVPFDTPYFHFTFIQIYNLYFKLGSKFNVSIIENINLNPDSNNNENINLYLGHIPLLIKSDAGYLNTKMIDTISNPSKYYKPYDSRFSHPAQIIYSKKKINNLTVKLCKTTSQGHVAEFAPNFYPKIVIAAPDEEDENNENYLILEDKVDCAQNIKVNLCSNMLNQIYSNSKREITISINDVIDENQNIDQDFKSDDDIKIKSKLFKVGQIVDVVIESISKYGINVEVLLSQNKNKNKPGFIQAIHANDSIKEIKKLQTNPDSFLSDLNIMIGKEYKAVIIDISDKEMIQLSLQMSVIQKYNKLQNLLTDKKILRLDIGQEINGIVTKIVPQYGLFVDLGVFGIAQLHITNAIKNLKNYQEINIEKMFTMNQIIRSRVIEISKENDMINISMRHLHDPHFIESPLSYNDVRKGSFVSGVVSMIDQKLGVIVWLSRYVKGRISFKHLNVTKGITSYTMAIQKYKIGKVIHDINVLFVSTENKRIELSLIESNKSKEKTKFLLYRINEMDVGDFVNVKFNKKLNNGNLSVYVPSSDFKIGIIPKKEITSHLLKDNNIQKMIKGDSIQVWVYQINTNQHNKTTVYFTMKSKSMKFGQSTADFNKQQIEQIKRQKRQRVGINMMREYEKLQQLKKIKEKQKSEEDGKMKNVDDDEDEDEDIKPLDMNWTLDFKGSNTNEMEHEHQDEDDTDHDDDDDDVVMEIDGDDEIKQNQQRQKTQKMEVDNNDKNEEEEEENVEWNELMKSEGFTTKPQKPKDFERLLVGSPDSSIIWIQYIAFYLAKKNTVRARGIIERALKEINISEDKERLNIWIAWMNLEMLYGTEQALINVFKKALQSNDKKDVYIQFIGVCQENKKYDLCIKYYTEMLHKFRNDTIVYINFGRFLYQHYMRNMDIEYLEQARDLLKRGIQELELKSQHISLIQKFAWNEYKYINKLSIRHDINVKNEGESMFEGLLKKYNNKCEIWRMYALAVYKFGHNKINNNKLQMARNIFERGLSQKNMKMSDTKWLFKQYLSFENKFGNRSPDHKDNVQHIKELAKRYVKNVSNNKNKK